MVANTMLHTHVEKWVFLERKIQFVTALDLTKCLKQITIDFSLLTHLSNISTMLLSFSQLFNCELTSVACVISPDFAK